MVILRIKDAIKHWLGKNDKIHSCLVRVIKKILESADPEPGVEPAYYTIPAVIKNKLVIAKTPTDQHISRQEV